MGGWGGGAAKTQEAGRRARAEMEDARSDGYDRVPHTSTRRKATQMHIYTWAMAHTKATHKCSLTRAGGAGRRISPLERVVPRPEAHDRPGVRQRQVAGGGANGRRAAALGRSHRGAPCWRRALRVAGWLQWYKATKKTEGGGGRATVY